MKTSKRIYLVLFLGLLGIFAKAADAPNLILSGSEKKVDDIVSKSDLIFVGRVASKGFISTAAPGLSGQEPTVNVTSVLKGQVGSEVHVTLYVKNNGRVIEAAPKIGESYIFFVKQGATQQLFVLKLLPATDANIVEIKQLISQTTK
jgi:hypothetical protein